MRDLQARTGDASLAETLQKVSLMLHAGWLHLWRDTTASAARLNLTLARAVQDGAPYKYLAVPGVGRATPLDPLLALLLVASAEGDTFADQPPSPDRLVERLAGVKGALNLSLQVGGVAQTTGPAFDAELKRQATEFSARLWPRWKALGMI